MKQITWALKTIDLDLDLDIEIVYYIPSKTSATCDVGNAFWEVGPYGLGISSFRALKMHLLFNISQLVLQHPRFLKTNYV